MNKSNYLFAHNSYKYKAHRKDAPPVAPPDCFPQGPLQVYDMLPTPISHQSLKHGERPKKGSDQWLYNTTSALNDNISPNLSELSM